jgi:hypothetical protein
LAERDMAHVTFIDLNDQTIEMERSNLKQRFSLLYRRAEHLAQIS